MDSKEKLYYYCRNERGLSHESSQEAVRVFEELAEGKTIYETMRVDKLPHYLAMCPKYWLTFIPWFIYEYITFGAKVIRLGIIKFFQRRGGEE